MMRKNDALTLLAGLVFSVAVPAVTSADSIGPGGSGAPDTLNVSGTVEATVSGDWTLQNAAHPPLTLATGTFEEWVVQDASTSHLDFVFALTNDSTSEDTVVSSSVFNYQGFSTDVGAGTSLNSGGDKTGGVTPGTVSRDSAGDTVNFQDINMPRGGFSQYLVVETNATTFDENGNLSLIDGGTSNSQVFEPSGTPATTAPLPLPIWGGLALMGLYGGMTMRRRSHRLA